MELLNIMSETEWILGICIWILGLTILNTIMIIYGRTRDRVNLERLSRVYDNNVNQILGKLEDIGDRVYDIDSTADNIWSSMD